MARIGRLDLLFALAQTELRAATSRDRDLAEAEKLDKEYAPLATSVGLRYIILITKGG